MSDITYSFIIPHKNTPHLLQRCLDSIPQRDDVEVIVVDNNSSERWVDFANYPGSGRPDTKILRDNVSIGAGGARNTGLKEVQGKWVLFADADDYYHPDVINFLDEYKDSDADVVYINHQIEKNGMPINNPYPYIDEYVGGDLDAIKYKHTVPWNKMVRRDFLLRNHICFEDCPVGNDIFYSYQVGYFSKEVIVEKRKTYNYVINKESTIHRKKNNDEFYVALFKHHYQCNEFMRFIHHTEWERNVLGAFGAILAKKGVGPFVRSLKVYRRNVNEIKSEKGYFVDQVMFKYDA